MMNRCLRPESGWGEGLKGYDCDFQFGRQEEIRGGNDNEKVGKIFFEGT